MDGGSMDDNVVPVKFLKFRSNNLEGKIIELILWLGQALPGMQFPTTYTVTGDGDVAFRLPDSGKMQATSKRWVSFALIDAFDSMFRQDSLHPWMNGDTTLPIVNAWYDWERSHRTESLHDLSERAIEQGEFRRWIQ
jgi:hypothetical protein